VCEQTVTSSYRLRKSSLNTQSDSTFPSSLSNTASYIRFYRTSTPPRRHQYRQLQTASPSNHKDRNDGNRSKTTQERYIKPTQNHHNRENLTYQLNHYQMQKATVATNRTETPPRPKPHKIPIRTEIFQFSTKENVVLHVFRRAISGNDPQEVVWCIRSRRIALLSPPHHDSVPKSLPHLWLPHHWAHRIHHQGIATIQKFC
jgi:hypothetical protein